jgi:hypothetical protein
MKNLNGLLERVINYMDRADAFLSDQVPIFCKQLMDYAAWETQYTYDISFWFTLIFAAITLILLTKGVFGDYGNEGAWLVSCCTGIVFIIAFCITTSCYKDLKMYKIAPKVYMVKIVKKMMVDGTEK